MGFQGKINIYRKKMKQVMMLSLIWYDSFTWFYSRCSDAGSSNLILLPFHWPPGAKRLTTQDSEIQNIPKCYQNTKRHRFFAVSLFFHMFIWSCPVLFIVFIHCYFIFIVSSALSLFWERTTWDCLRVFVIFDGQKHWLINEKPYTTQPTVPKPKR